MKKLNYFFLSFVLLSAAAHAQQKAADSLYLYDQDKQQILFVQQNGTQLVSSPIVRLSTARLSYQTANGHFRTSQVAENTSAAAFGTAGIATLGRFKLYGDLSFKKTWQDSLSWSLKGVENDSQPYYFGAIKAGTWERINYTLNTVAVYQLPGNHFAVAGGINYFYNTAARSVDPRASVQTFRLMLTPELIYRTNKHTIGLSGLWGYEHEENGISYRNVAFSTGQNYPDRILYQVFGYGSFTPAGVRTLRRNGKYKGVGISYAYQDSTRYLRTELKHRDHNEDDLFFIPRTIRYNHLGSFFLNQESFAILAGNTSKHYRHQFNATVNYNSGYDLNKTLNASSYKYKHVSAYASYNIQQQNTSNNQWELGANLLYTDHSQRDLSASHLFAYTFIQPGGTFAFYHRYATADRLRLSLSPAIRLPLKNQLFIPPGELNAVFNNNVTYPDQAYFTATAGILTSSAEYITPRLFRSVYSSVSANMSYDHPFNSGTVNPAAALKPSGSFLTANFHFNIYF